MTPSATNGASHSDVQSNGVTNGNGPRGRLAGKNAIITGAAGMKEMGSATIGTVTYRNGRLSFHNQMLTVGSGIGLETTILFAREGANVIMADISGPALEKGKAKVLEVVPHAGKLETVICDVTKEAEIEALVGRVDAWGGLDVIFNNAGIMHGEDADAIETPEKIWDLTMSINVKGVWFGCKHAILNMRKHGKKAGSVINVASVVALVGSATPQLAYTASKGAVLALTRELAIVHARENFRFNALCPAPLNTPLLQDWLGDDAVKRARREVHFPMGRFGEAVEQAQSVLFLASDESSFITGTDFVVDGGMTRCYITPEGAPTEPPLNLAK